MKKLATLFGVSLGLTLLGQVAFAQKNRLSKWSSYDAVTAIRFETQQANLSGLNGALQEAGYGQIGNQFNLFNLTSQIARANRPLAFVVELGVAANRSATNGTYRVSANFINYKLGAAYRMINKDRFQVGPQLSVMSQKFQITVERPNGSQPTLASALANPGNAEKATLRTTTLGLDAGLTGTVRFPYGRPKQVDCATIERSFVIGLDAGYRFSARVGIDDSREINANNPAVQLSGWYIGAKLGFGSRITRTASPVMN